MAEIFERTFKCELQPLTAGSQAARLLVEGGKRREYEDFRPTRFVAGPEGEGQYPEYPWVAKGPEPKDFLGNEFLVNSTTTGAQTASAVATLASGRFVVTWNDASATGGDTSVGAIRGQLFEANGTPVGGEFLVNTETANGQVNSTIAELAGGGFVVGWADSSLVGGDSSGSGSDDSDSSGSGSGDPGSGDSSGSGSGSG